MKQAKPSSRAAEARRLYAEEHMPLHRIAKKLGVKIERVEHYQREDSKKGKSWDEARFEASFSPERLKQDYRVCLSRILNEAKQTLDALEQDPSLPPAQKAKELHSLMQTIQRANKIAQAAEPAWRMERVIAQVIQLVGEVLLEQAPELSELFLLQTHELEKRIISRKEDWIRSR